LELVFLRGLGFDCGAEPFFFEPTGGAGIVSFFSGVFDFLEGLTDAILSVT
jgi:hypothetical protein